VRTPSFQAPKSVRPERRGICETVGKDLVEVEIIGTEGIEEGLLR
jgi:hypothetical protein